MQSLHYLFLVLFLWYCCLSEDRKSALLNSAMLSSSLGYFQEKMFRIICYLPGRSLSVLNSTNIMVNPLDLKEAHSLRGW